MCKYRVLLSLLLCAALLLSMAGCGAPKPVEPEATAPPVTEAPTEAPTEPPVSDQYTKAAQPLRDAKNLSVKLTTKKAISTEMETFDLVSQQELTLSGVGTDAFTAAMTEELEIGDLRDEFTEYYADGVLFVNIYDTGRFQGTMTEEAFLNRFAPAVLLDETLYQDISEKQTDAGTTLTFSAPTAPESWALPAGAEFLSAGGTAKINDQGTLTRTTYTMEYIQGNTRVTMEVEAKAELYDEEAPEAPPEPDIYKEVESIDALRLYDTAILYIFSAQSAASTINESLICEAAGYYLNEQTATHYMGTGQDHISEIKYSASTLDGSMVTETFSQTERFRDGLYTYISEDGQEEPDSSVTAQDMTGYIQSYFLDNIPALTYIQDARIEDLGGVQYLEIELNEEWGQIMASYATGMVYEDEEFLNNCASAYETYNSRYYMALDAATGFPTAAGTAYVGVHTIEGQGYMLGLQIDQSFALADSSIYQELTGESLPEEVPETQATPLLYHVQGAEGQEMYLLGTIHVGDAHTAYLPDAFYNALNSSDALAVEADIIAFEEAMEEDPAIAAQLADLYFYADGTTTSSLVDEDVYQKAVRLLRSSGSYNANMEYAKPYIWTSAIENFYLTLGSLRSEKGMDMRLLEMAKAQDKEILEVESGMFQMEMFGNFSSDLQVMLLEETVSYTVEEFRDEVEELYALWCAGDEDAIREFLAEDNADLTEEEMALYQEYIDAMIISRNANMLDVAVSYLESGDTVFYAVGLAHLLQENGLVDTLRDAGFTVEQVAYT
ncbi:MAG: TraB/GumN family protein [Oscillospiraceae bacterium]|nr:TraB/GumN family protein [Oscillospiraceae bacterium]